ncbi:serine/threonine-protein kinase [Drepanopeziza brunnea f. sp. 'multigermtubi' MB_m1]|uniref:Serine/threonine-protein kinase n=1 Tax=Marssonina brunnea f. sp. multigermtubi (strain MB_m1) TaxID=1072389 RepID=K1XHU7_MARBU|nr:serine/threonine-protein kinase [Drepanopeziza brunnea f. sp. 'multigermtubi' MB_m1]EKD20338.1 serine/threonine-protein kinase [Drepanopeziza brunnea f. sp. 'multigermtubi' MB_m1]
MECLRESFYDGVVLDGRFKTVSPLNHGSFGMVFMAEDLTNNEKVAIKCLTKKSAIIDGDYSFAVDEQSEELACHARLGNHPNIVNMIHSFETEAHIYIVLEFCSRGDLYEAIRTGTGPLETEHVRRFMLQLVDAVDYIHAKGMYHRDIKPENIFLTQAGEMKLGDFGLATTEKWTFETTVGSDRYMSPEQYDSAGAGYAPEKADIWAIGICLLNILFSRNPFTTPTESDPLFLDFTRDKQSLFDVFPTMSMDTFEVITQCMSLDPRKRSLTGAREALERLVSFTTFDESLDDFCMAERRGIASANREPLRTPSIQSPHVDNGSFPWAKALQASPPHQFRQLSVIADDESYSEDLFPNPEDHNKGWFPAGQQTPSMASVLDSTLGASMKSMAIRPPMKSGPPKASLTPISGSLPITMSKPVPLPSLASVFGKKNEVASKSWSDLWDEEEEEEEADRQLKARQMQNSRTWSHESKHEEDVKNAREPLEPKNSSSVNISKLSHDARLAAVNDIDGDLVADGFFFHDAPEKEEVIPASSPPRYSPPPKRATSDKWSKLGERRRALNGTSDSEKPRVLWNPHERVGHVGLGLSGFRAGVGVWENRLNMVVKDMSAKPKSKGCPWAKERARDPQGYNRHGDQIPDLEWAGGYNDLHL